jgi:hypothetical protein
MSVEKDSTDAAQTEGSAETTAELVPGAKPAAVKGTIAKNELRIITQVEVRTDISEEASGGKSANKITVVNHQIRSVIHVIGGGDLEREGDES